MGDTQAKTLICGGVIGLLRMKSSCLKWSRLKIYGVGTGIAYNKSD
ncbi:uncharacterized protein G2W53_012849 [Senna tora]|uniref:Uncharacterized protein n=1 Tax=Senna tora TaxID=362788 RepID=A0A834U1F6_9FABA|nr:uncharacterized protein G2W53_012849 [Senna tora]